MADYSQAKYEYDALVANEKASADAANKIAAEAAEPRRITGNSITSIDGSGFTTGGFVPAPGITVSPKMKHKVVFESAGSKFTIAELANAFVRLSAAAKASELTIMSWDEYFNAGIEGSRTAKNAQVAIVEWEE